ncbi:ComEC/Rec2 family competence protein [Clostridium sp. BJN0001]|uniref:ComEC/Rec2 family competence protein n=1 Tax=Clostridium sp. BJN0001 TaxID=2930219 RepID=UPI001FCFABFD|nr:ComEC/Rec2 family competence protein [Clostridium sp. BJN0001]
MKLKKFILIFLGIILTINIFSCNKFNTNFPYMKIHFINVGQGDAILIQVNNKNLLIDSGPSESKDMILNYLDSQNIKKLDFVVATHPHEDHIGNMSSIINSYPIDYFCAPKVTSDAKYFERMIYSLKKKNLKINVLNINEKCPIDLGKNTEVKVLSPTNRKYDNINNYSCVLKIKFLNNTFLFMGDAEKEAEDEILSNFNDIHADVIKIGHHGSETSTSNEFLQRVSPKISIISCGYNNNFGHPHKKTLDKLKNITKIYRTDMDDNIVLISNGHKILKLKAP